MALHQALYSFMLRHWTLQRVDSVDTDVVYIITRCQIACASPVKHFFYKALMAYSVAIRCEDCQ